MIYHDQIINEATGERLKEMNLDKENLAISLSFAIAIQVRIDEYMRGLIGPKNFLESIIELQDLEKIDGAEMFSFDRVAEWDDRDPEMRDVKS